MRQAYNPAAVALSIILIGSTTFSQSGPQRPEISANELARRVVTNELKGASEDHSHWMYRLGKEESRKKQVREIVQTKEGSFDELLSVNDRPLTAGQKREENHRIQKLISSPDEQRKLERERNEDAAQSRRLLQMLPDAFVFSYAEQGDLIKLNFRPNPNFHPLSREARVFHAMEGEMWIDHKQERLAEITGHLVQDVKFGGGFLGHLDKGGQFEVKQAEVAPGHWDITVLNVDMKGKALFFKTIGVHEKEYRSNFRRVADDLTPAQAADILSRQTVEAIDRS
jgi:hypothetical protein